jgi:hypothetical protein
MIHESAAIFNLACYNLYALRGAVCFDLVPAPKARFAGGNMVLFCSFSENIGSQSQNFLKT